MYNSIEEAILGYLDEQDECAQARKKIVNHLKELNPYFWQTCEHCGCDFRSKGNTLCDFCIEELPGFFTDDIE